MMILSQTAHNTRRVRRATMSHRALIDINLLRDLRYILTDSICAVALDMFPCRNEIYIISKTS